MVDLYFAGTTKGNYKKLLDNGVRLLLFTYYELKNNKNTRDIFEYIKKEYPETRIFIDSGTHSFTTEYAIGVYKHRLGGRAKKPLDRRMFHRDILKYIKDYINWLKTYKKYVDIYVSLDVDEIVGPKMVDDYNKIFKDCNLNPLVVWHPERKIIDFETMCKENDYIGIGGAKVEYKHHEFQLYSRLFGIARKYKTKVHGFALTRPPLLKKCCFYSADSTSWQRAFKFGQADFFVSGTMKTRQIKTRDGDYLFRHNVKAWLRFQRFIDEFWEGKKYWEANNGTITSKN